MLFNKYAVSVKRHIREGICIPLDVKPDLVRNITTRNHVVVNVHSTSCTAVCHVLLGYRIRIGYCILVFTILPVWWGMWLE